MGVPTTPSGPGRTAASGASVACAVTPEALDGDSVLRSMRARLGIIGTAPAFVQALRDLARFAQVDVPILISGETGTGKEVAARAIHYLSARADGPFVPMNCGALPERLLENELYGHGRGAFTDAREEQAGLIAQASGGTMLFDEIDCLDQHSQAALLRFLQDRRYRPLGAQREREANVRIIAASNACLDDHVTQGRFRADLLYRLDVARVELPPLRDRREDILPLARHILGIVAQRYAIAPPAIGTAAQDWLLTQDWPGNVRQLENVIHRAMLLREDGMLALPPAKARPAAADDASRAPGRLRGTLKVERARLTESFERTYLMWVLQDANGNVSQAARQAGTERRHLGRMIRRHGIDVSTFRR